MSHTCDNMLDAEHTLRGAEASECRVWWRIGSHHFSLDVNVFNVVTVKTAHRRPIAHANWQILSISNIQVNLIFQSRYSTRFVKADRVLELSRMARASRQHILIALEHTSNRSILVGLVKFFGFTLFLQKGFARPCSVMCVLLKKVEQLLINSVHIV